MSKELPFLLLQTPKMTFFTSFRFIDLAQIICKVPETVPDHNLSSSEDEIATGYASEPGVYRQRSFRHYQKRTISLSDADLDSDDMDELPIRLTSPPVKNLVNKSPSKDDA